MSGGRADRFLPGIEPEHEQGERGNEAGGGWNGETLEILVRRILSALRGKAIEPRETQGAAGKINKGDEHAVAVEIAEHDVKGEQGGGHAEGHNVGQRIKFAPEGTFVPPEAREAPVEQIENAGPEDEPDRGMDLPRGTQSGIHLDDRVEDIKHRGESAEQVARGHEIGQEVNPRCLVVWFGVHRAVEGWPAGCVV